MTAPVSAENLLAANARYAATFSEGSLPMPPARHVAIVTCMDARVEPLRALNFSLGDAHVIRNAGGRVTDDAIRSLAISERLLNTDAILVIHHTDCGMLTFTNDDIRAKIRSDLGEQAGAAAQQQDFLPFADLEQSVRDDVAAIQASPLVPDNIPVHGFIYDVHTGTLTPVA